MLREGVRTVHRVITLISQLLRVAVIKLDVFEPGRLGVSLEGVDAVAVGRRRLRELCVLERGRETTLGMKCGGQKYRWSFSLSSHIASDSPGGRDRGRTRLGTAGHDE